MFALLALVLPQPASVQTQTPAITAKADVERRTATVNTALRRRGVISDQ
jgi:hypothetical protein